MVIRDFNWMAGGPQGSGVDVAANIYGRACGYGGLYVFATREYHSNIKGLHSYLHLRVSPSNIIANVNKVDLLAAFDAETVVRHLTEVVPQGGIIVDEEQIETNVLNIPTLPYEFKSELQKFMEQNNIGEHLSDFLGYSEKAGVRLFRIPYMSLLENVGAELGVDKMSRIIRMVNVLTIGVSFALLNYDQNLVERAIKSAFSERPKIVEMNLVALKEAYNYTQRTFKDSFKHRLETVDNDEPRIFLSGNQAVAMGKVLGGCRVQTYYPITPAADESEYLEANEILKTQSGEASIVVVQTEDEIAAINSASGAALTGARAATSTSGPGFSLMVEGLSWAGNCEVPIVITYYQRGAPSTGLPTRSGQADLEFVLHAGHGEFPRIVVSSGDIRECFYDAARVFNYAEKYQMPVIHLLDKALANSTQTYPIFEVGKFKIERGEILDETQLQGKEYKRFLFTETGVSPRVFLGTKNGVHWYTGDEHNEFGHISEEPINRNKMMEKRMKKLQIVEREIPIEEKVNFFGDKDSDNMIVSWGSPKGAVLETLDALKAEGYSLGFVQVRMLHPLPKEYIANAFKDKKRRIVVENNYLSQLGRVIKQETEIVMNYEILKYNGRPMTTTEVYGAVKNVLDGKAAGRQVLTFGS